MLEKPKHLGRAYAEQFQDVSVAEAYHLRPPHSPEVFEILSGLADPDCHSALDIGCGTGPIARGLAKRMQRVDAIDFSPRMIEIGKSLPGGDCPNINWICSSVEEAPLSPPYGLATAGDSLHWMDWRVVMPRLREALLPERYLAIIEQKPALRAWPIELGELISRYSTNKDYQPFDLVSGLVERGLFEKCGEIRTQPVEFHQLIADYVEAFHSQNGFSRDRMNAEAAAGFDREAAAALGRVFPEGSVRMLVSARISWGFPLSTPAK
jgi:SAM-dependent methyltransferase